MPACAPNHTIPSVIIYITIPAGLLALEDEQLAGLVLRPVAE
jgi:hypothetical protein